MGTYFVVDKWAGFHKVNFKMMKRETPARYSGKIYYLNNEQNNHLIIEIYNLQNKIEELLSKLEMVEYKDEQ